jgi:hypothetical protein
MSYVTMDEAQAHLKQRLDDDFHDIALKIEASEVWAAEFLNRPLSDLLIEVDSPPSLDGGDLNPAVKLAILERLEAFYHRDPANMEKLIADARDVLYPFRVGLGV